MTNHKKKNFFLIKRIGMKLGSILEKATDFGSFRSRENIFSFGIKVLLYIIPASILGHVTDRSVLSFKEQGGLGPTLLPYIVLQTLFIVLTLYLLVLYLKEFTSEFQVTVVGGYFIVLYFGLQTQYIKMLKEYLTSVLKV